MIFSANKLFPLNACFQYSSIFHSIAASNSHLSLDQNHPDLWLKASGLGNLDTQISKQWLALIVRLDPTNYPENCTCSPFHDNWNQLELLIIELLLVMVFPYTKDQLVAELLQPCLACHVSVAKLYNR